MVVKFFLDSSIIIEGFKDNPKAVDILLNLRKILLKSFL